MSQTLAARRTTASDVNTSQVRKLLESLSCDFQYLSITAPIVRATAIAITRHAVTGIRLSVIRLAV